MQHAAIFKKKNVKFDEDSLDHLEFYASGQSSAPGKGADGKIPGLPRKVSCSRCGSRLADGVRLM